MEYTQNEREILSLIERTDFKILSKRAARQMEQRISAVAEEVKKDQAALPAEGKALGA